MIEENHEKTSVRFVDTGIWTRDLPNASLVRYHGATSLGNSSLVERGRSLMDPQLKSLLHFLIQMEPTFTNVFLQVSKNLEVTRGKILAVRRILKCFPAKSLKLISHQIGSMGTGVIMQKDYSVRQHSRAFWLRATSQFLQRVCIAFRIDCDSSLLASISNTGRNITLHTPPDQ